MTDASHHIPRQTDIERKNVDHTLNMVDEHVRIISHIYPSCETNTTMVASFLATAAILRAKHICLHEKPGETPSAECCSDNLESMIEALSEAFTKAVSVAVKAPDRPVTSGELLQKIFDAISRAAKETE